jgi:hypothetical protein
MSSKRHDSCTRVEELASSSTPGDRELVSAWEPPGYRYLDEREANAFAALLLMDEQWVRRDFASGLRDVGSLAERYEVSPAAMGFRLVNLGLA